MSKSEKTGQLNNKKTLPIVYDWRGFNSRAFFMHSR